MKKILIPLLALCATAVIAADPGDKTTTSTTTSNGDGTSTTRTTTTTSDGTITEYAPGQTFTIKESSGPVQYHYGKSVTYETRKGKHLTEEEVHTRIKVGVPVHVHYDRDGDRRVISRVIIDD